MHFNATFSFIIPSTTMFRVGSSYHVLKGTCFVSKFKLCGFPYKSISLFNQRGPLCIYKGKKSFKGNKEVSKEFDIPGRRPLKLLVREKPTKFKDTSKLSCQTKCETSSTNEITNIDFIKKNQIKNANFLDNNCNNFTKNSNYRENDLKIQMLSQSLHNKIFQPNSKSPPTCDEIKRSILHLQHHGLWGKETSHFPEVNLDLPILKGKNLEDHFQIIAESQCGIYKELLSTLLASNFPHQPLNWNFCEGWTRYNSDGEMVKVDYPDCNALVFDIEVCLTEGQHPTLACAVSNKYWYSWCSGSLIDSSKKVTSSLYDLIPFDNRSLFSKDSKKCIPKIIVGHNVSFDRRSIKEQYFLEPSELKFVDTMALHIAVSGLVEEQRTVLMKNKKAEEKIRLPWMSVGCANSLKDIYKFYCSKELQKESRETFVKGTIQEVRENFQQLMMYCAEDVKATYYVLNKLLPLFFERFPHPVTFAGMLEMSTTYLPVGSSWNQYTKSSEEKFKHFNDELNAELVEQAINALKLHDGEKYKDDLWLWDLDWTLPKGKVKSLWDYPNWYRKLCKTTDGEKAMGKPQNMSTSLRIVPKLLRLTWNGYPLHYKKNKGWGFLKPCESALENNGMDNSKSDEFSPTIKGFPLHSLLEICKKKSLEAKDHLKEESGFDIGIPHVKFYPLPHKNGEGNNVGNPLAKDFLIKLEDHTLSSAVDHLAELVLKTSKTIAYWKNNRFRILSQIVMWLDHRSLPAFIKKSDEYNVMDDYGAILPQILTFGTITRRVVEKTWMTASNAYADRIGSELKSMIKAPPGYHFVGADVDSQELWIASVLGDSYFGGQHGSTALGWMTLQGNKAEGTDMHSRTALTAGISRDNAKVINYARIYGAGIKFTQRLLKQYNYSLDDEECRRRAVKLFAATKGEKGWCLNREGKDMAYNVNFQYHGEPLTSKELQHLVKLGRNSGYSYYQKDIIDGKSVWVGGSESHMFNCLETIACMDQPSTPVLRARITRALEPWCVDDQFMTSRVNWVVQSSAVDFLHLMLVCMKWLFTEYNINGRFSISIHDEVRYLVASEDRYRAALALHITNLLTRSFISSRLGLNDLPQSVAFFGGVDVDKVMRKESDMDCVTPSNPQGLSQGYNVNKGETLNIYEVIEKTKGKLQLD